MSLPPITDLFDLLPDNTTGQIEPVDLRYITQVLYNGIVGNLENQATYLTIQGDRDLVDNYTPINPQSVATKKYIDDALLADNFVSRSGDTMTGRLTLIPQFPTLDNHAVNKAYADQVTDDFMPLAGGTFTGTVYGNGLSPDTPRTLVDRAYVASVIQDAGAGNVTTEGDNFYAPSTTQYFDKIQASQATLGSITYGGDELQNTIDDLQNEITSSTDDLLNQINDLQNYIAANQAIIKPLLTGVTINPSDGKTKLQEISIDSSETNSKAHTYRLQGFIKFTVANPSEAFDTPKLNIRCSQSNAKSCTKVWVKTWFPNGNFDTIRSDLNTEKFYKQNFTTYESFDRDLFDISFTVPEGYTSLEYEIQFETIVVEPDDDPIGFEFFLDPDNTTITVISADNDARISGDTVISLQSY